MINKEEYDILRHLDKLIVFRKENFNDLQTFYHLLKNKYIRAITITDNNNKLIHAYTVSCTGKQQITEYAHSRITVVLSIVSTICVVITLLLTILFHFI